MKKTGKRLSALLLALVMVLSLVPVTALAAQVEDAPAALAEAVDTDGLVNITSQCSITAENTDTTNHPIPLLYDGYSNTYWGASKGFADDSGRVAFQLPANAGTVKAVVLQFEKSQTAWGVTVTLSADGEQIDEQVITSFANDYVYSGFADEQEISSLEVALTSPTNGGNLGTFWPAIYEAQIWVDPGIDLSALSQQSNIIAEGRRPAEVTLTHSLASGGTESTAAGNCTHLGTWTDGASTENNFYNGALPNIINAPTDESAHVDLDLGAVYDVSAIQIIGPIANRTDFYTYDVQTKSDASGAWTTQTANVVVSLNSSFESAAPGTAAFASPLTTQYIRLVFHGYGGSYGGITELKVLGVAHQEVTDPETDSNGEIQPDDSSRDINYTTYTMSASSTDNPQHATEGPADYAKDNDLGKFWHSAKTSAPHWIQVELQTATWVSALRYLPRTDKKGATSDFGNGYVTDYHIEVSLDGQTWTKPEGGSGTWNPRDEQNRITAAWEVANFEPVLAKYIRLVGEHTLCSNLAADQAMHANEIRIVSAPAYTGEPRSVSGTVMDGAGAALGGVTVCIGDKETTSAEETGTFTVEELRDNYTYTVTATKEGYALVDGGTVVVNGSNVTEHTITMRAKTANITVKVQTSSGAPVTGSKVTLTNAATYTVQSGVTVNPKAGEDGSYTIDISGLEAGTYYARASKDNSGAMINTDLPIVVSDGIADDLNYTVTLSPFDDSEYKGLGYDIKSFDFETGSNHPETTAGSQVTANVSDGRLALVFSGRQRQNQLVTLANTPLKNGEVEFDATRVDGRGARFGLGLRVGAGKQDPSESDFDRWIYVGQFSNTTEWGYEFWNKGSNSFWSKPFNTNVPSFAAGETRHFKVKLSGNDGMTLDLWIDGIHVINNAKLTENYAGGQQNLTPPTEAGNAGFLYGDGASGNPGEWDGGASNDGDTVYIDNLRVVRFDPAFEVDTAASINGGSLSIQTKASATADATPLPADKRVPEGSTVIVTGTPSEVTHMLDAITLTKTSDGSAVTDITITYNSADGTFSFPMPAYAVTVNGTFLPKLTADDVEIQGDRKEGATLKAVVTPGGSEPAEGETFTYQWYHQVDGGEWQRCYATPSGDQNGQKASSLLSHTDFDHFVKVEVWGDGINHAAHFSVEKVTDSVIGPADVATTGISFERDSVAMWMNANEGTTTGNVVGTQTTLRATISPENATNKSVTWSVENADGEESDVVTLSEETVNGNIATAKVTAAKNGSVTVKATVGSSDGVSKTAAIPITVSTQVTGITVADDSQNPVTSTAPLVIYVNTNNEKAPHSKHVTATVSPDTASNKALTWTRTGTNRGLITLTPTGGEASGSGTVGSSGLGITIAAASTSATDVGAVQVEVASTSNTSLAPVSFTVEVRRMLESQVSITNNTPDNDGEFRIGNTLGVSFTNLQITEGGEAALKYTWKRSKNGTTDVAQAAATAENGGSTYTLTAADIGATITVEVEADTTTYYEGTLTYTTTATVEPEKGPEQPTLTHTDITESGGTGTITITNYNSAYTYEYSTDGQQWTTAEGTVESGNYVIKNLSEGDYQVRVKAVTQDGIVIREASLAGTASIFGFNVTGHNITVVKTGTGDGQVELSANRAAQGKNITITITANANSVLKGTPAAVTLVDGEGGKVEGTQVTVNTSEEANQFTFEMPNADVQITVTFDIKQLRIYHDLPIELQCDLSSDHDSEENGVPYHTVNYGFKTDITLTLKDSLPDQPDYDKAAYDLENTVVTVTNKDNSDTSFTMTPTKSAGKIVLSFTSGIQKNIVVTVTEVPKKTYSVHWTLDGLNVNANGVTRITHGTQYTATLSVEDSANYALPTEIEVKMGESDDPLVAGQDYTYTNGVLTIEKVTGNLEISASAVRTLKPVTKVEIRSDGGSLPPTVDDILVASVTPSDAKVTYEWFRWENENDTTGGTSIGTDNYRYQLTSAEQGKWISVKVTGKTDDGYTDSVESAKVGSVKAKVIPATGVSIDGLDESRTITVVFGESKTLTATVTPAEATNQDVVWTVTEGTDVISIGETTGVITTLKAGTATVQVRTTNDDPPVASCTVTVTAADLTSVTLSKKNNLAVGDTLTATVLPAEATANDMTVTWYRVDDNEGKTTLTADANKPLEYTIKEADAGCKIMVSVEGKNNYKETVSDVTTGKVPAVGGETPTTYTVTANDGDHYTASVAAGPFTGEEAVPVTITPESGYEITSVSVTIGSETAVEDTSYTVSDPDAATGAVTVTILAGFEDDVVVTATATKKEQEPDPGPGDDKVDTTELAQAIKDAEALNSTDYTEDSWAVVEEALSAAKETLADETATQDDVDAAAKALTDAIAALEEKGEEPGPGDDKADTTELAQAIKDAEALNSTDYTEDSWAAVEEALSAAKETLADEDATQDDVDDALDALTAAVNALVKKDTDEPEPDQPTRKPIRPATPSPSSSENPDGSKETVETKPDGTVTETVENPDGSKEIVETKPDGTVVETVENPDGSKEIVETKPDGTVIDTVVAADGATTEKVTDAEGDVTITVTDAEGEELAKVELPATVPTSDDEFIDLDPTPWAEEAINHMAGLGLVNGVGDEKYAPTASMTRGALATVLYRLSQGKTDYNVTFQDVAQGEYYTEGVAWAARVNVVTGYTEDIFAPGDTITREQLAVMLVRYAKLIGMDTTADTASLDVFVDGDATGDWAVDGMAWCVEKGILQGKGADNLDPTAKISRAEVAVMLDRFIALIK